MEENMIRYEKEKSLIMHTNWDIAKSWYDKKTLLSSKLYEMDSIYFSVDIEIIKVYKFDTDKDKEKEPIQIYEWENYGVINQTYTNISPIPLE